MGLPTYLPVAIVIEPVFVVQCFHNKKVKLWFRYQYLSTSLNAIKSFTTVGLASKLIMIFLLLFFYIPRLVYGGPLQCQVTDVKSLLEGCDRLVGLNVTTVGGTIVNDHNCDVLLPKQVFSEEPIIQYELSDSKKFYTILMVDPDAAPQITGEFFMHLLKSNVPGIALKSSDGIKTVGTDYRGYKQPSPPRGTGPHRYMILLYEQADGSNFLPPVPPRSRFKLASWMRGKNLCGPVAATQFRLEF